MLVTSTMVCRYMYIFRTADNFSVDNKGHHQSLSYVMKRPAKRVKLASEKPRIYIFLDSVLCVCEHVCACMYMCACNCKAIKP